MHGKQNELPFLRWENPLGHAAQLLAALCAMRSLYVPGAHFLHPSSEESPGRSPYLPDKHALHALALFSAGLLDHIPGRHFLHAASIGRPPYSLYVPGGQGRHADDAFAPVSAENNPRPQNIHCLD
jgi:hypothetical protein